MTANRAASIRARLKQHADATKKDFNLVLTRYGIERLLYRLATSEHTAQFVLRGISGAVPISRLSSLANNLLTLHN